MSSPASGGVRIEKKRGKGRHEGSVVKLVVVDVEYSHSDTGSQLSFSPLEHAKVRGYMRWVPVADDNRLAGERLQDQCEHDSPPR